MNKIIKNNNTKKEERIESVKIDDLVEKLDLNPNFIKIDVEGSEYEVLQGAINTLKNHKALIMLEKHPPMIPKNITIDTIDNLLNETGYQKECLIYRDDIAITEMWKKNS